MHSNWKIKNKLLFFVIFFQIHSFGQGVKLEDMPPSITLTNKGRNVIMFENSVTCISDIEPYLKSLKTIAAYNQYNKANKSINLKAESVSFFNSLVFGAAAAGTIGQSVDRGKVFGGIAAFSLSVGLIAKGIKKYHIKKAIELYNEEMKILKSEISKVE